MITVRHTFQPICVCLLALAILMPSVASAQLSSPSFQMNVNGVGEAGVGTAEGATTGIDSSNGPVFTLSDTATPTPPTNLATTSVGETNISISWTASTDDTGIASYEVFRDGALVGTINDPTTSFADTGLSANTTYSYTLVAIDVVGKRSATSSALSATTDEATTSSGGSGGGGGSSSSSSDDEAAVEEDPTEDVGVAITEVAPSDTAVGLLGEVVSGDDLSVYFVVSKTNSAPECTGSDTRYNIVGSKNTADTFSYTISGLTPGTTHYARLCGRDSAGELVAASAVDSFTTTGEAPVEPVEPVDPADPSIDPTDPTVPDTDPVDPTLPATDPADPATDPVDPTDSTEEQDDLTPAEAAELPNEERYDAAERELIEEHRIPYRNDGEVFSVTQPFPDGSSVTVTIWPDSVLDADGNPVGPDTELIVIISEHFLPIELFPEFDLNATSIGGVIFSVKVVDQFGNAYTKFDPDLMLEIDIAWPEQEPIPEPLSLYFLEQGDAGWTRIPDATFEGTTVLFSVDHLTLFGAWGVSDSPDFMQLEDGRDAARSQLGEDYVASDTSAQCGVFFWIIPVPSCWPWWVWLVLIAFVAYMYYRHSRERE